MWIIKIGGSLTKGAYLSEWLQILAQYGAGKVVIVPGGGGFADQVRKSQQAWRFNDHYAHRMALHAMDQYGLMLAGIAADQGNQLLVPASSEDELLTVIDNAGVPIWLPSRMLDQNTEISQNWDVTSDSLAAWLAEYLHADQLVLVKKGIKKVFCAKTYIDYQVLAADGTVDPAFRAYAENARFRTTILGASQSPYIKAMLIAYNTSEKASGSVIK